MTSLGETLLAAVERLPSVTVDVDGARSSAEVRVGAAVVAHIDLHESRVLVRLPADRIPTLQDVFPSARPAVDGIVFDLVDPGHCSDALAAIRRRAHVETLVPQFREASP